jgi:hypothetical protein
VIYGGGAARRGLKLACGLGLHAGGHGLDELHLHAVGVYDVERVVAGARLAGDGFDGEAFGDQVGAHLLDIVDGEADLAQVVGRRSGWLVEEFDVLAVVDFDEGDDCVWRVCRRHAGFVDVVGLVEAEEVVPEGDGFGQVGNEVADVGDAGDVGSGWGGGLGEAEWGGEKHDREIMAFNLFRFEFPLVRVEQSVSRWQGIAQGGDSRIPSRDESDVRIRLQAKCPCPSSVKRGWRGASFKLVGAHFTAHLVCVV